MSPGVWPLQRSWKVPYLSLWRLQCWGERPLGHCTFGWPDLPVVQHSRLHATGQLRLLSRHPSIEPLGGTQGRLQPPSVWASTHKPTNGMASCRGQLQLEARRPSWHYVLATAQFGINFPRAGEVGLADVTCTSRLSPVGTILDLAKAIQQHKIRTLTSGIALFLYYKYQVTSRDTHEQRASICIIYMYGLMGGS